MRQHGWFWSLNINQHMCPDSKTIYITCNEKDAWCVGTVTERWDLAFGKYVQTRCLTLGGTHTHVVSCGKHTLTHVSHTHMHAQSGTLVNITVQSILRPELVWLQKIWYKVNVLFDWPLHPSHAVMESDRASRQCVNIINYIIWQHVSSMEQPLEVEWYGQGLVHLGTWCQSADISWHARWNVS